MGLFRQHSLLRSGPRWRLPAGNTNQSVALSDLTCQPRPGLRRLQYQWLAGIRTPQNRGRLDDYAGVISIVSLSRIRTVYPLYVKLI